MQFKHVSKITYHIGSISANSITGLHSFLSHILPQFLETDHVQRPELTSLPAKINKKYFNKLIYI